MLKLPGAPDGVGLGWRSAEWHWNSDESEHLRRLEKTGPCVVESWQVLHLGSLVWSPWRWKSNDRGVGGDVRRTEDWLVLEDGVEERDARLVDRVGGTEVWRIGDCGLCR